MANDSSDCAPKSARAEPGMVTAEWALTIPLFIAIAMLCVSVIAYTNSMALTTNAARESARAYAIGMGESKAVQVAHALAGETAEVKLSVEGEYVRVKIAQPLVPALAFLGVSVAAEHIALIEPGAAP